MLTSPPVQEVPIPQNRIGPPTTEDLFEEVRQLRATMSVYRQLVNRLLSERANCPKREPRRIRNRSAA